MVDIIFRPESKGASPQRGWRLSSTGFFSPWAAAKFTSAASVGSPMAPFSSSAASLHSAMAVASSSVGPVCSTTVILFCVRVPVLSEQMTWVQPSVSTAVSRRITACCLLMLVTPMLSTTVTTVASPSGMAATARETATINVLSTVSSVNSPATTRSKIKMNTQMPSTSLLMVLPSSFSLRCRGVCSCSVWASTPAILPISVSMPVEVMTALPRP